jgi:copper chaperone CopZ
MDQLVVIKIEGMHCHKCEQAIQRDLGRQPGVHEVEVDFNSAQASVLFDPGKIAVGQLMERIGRVGYKAIGFTAGNPDHATETGA